VWLGDVDKDRMSSKASQYGYDLDSLDSVYNRLVISFENNFSGEDTDTKVSLEQLKLDRGCPLELKIRLTKSYEGLQFQWCFDLNVLRDSSAIAILKNIMLYQSTIIMSLNEYRTDLIRLIQQKDSGIRYLTEIINSMNGQELIHKWAPDNSMNKRTITMFDPVEFDSLWKEKRLVKFQDECIWDVLDTNYKNDTWSYGSTFKDFRDGEKKRLIEDQKEVNSKRRRITNVENLSQDLRDYDLKKNDTNAENSTRIPKESPKRSTFPMRQRSPNRQGSPIRQHPPVRQILSRTKQEPPVLNPDEPEVKLETPELNPETIKSSTRPRQTFGGSRKRTISQKSYSPIKAAKRFHSPEK
jgi:hypothetical protein